MKPHDLLQPRPEGLYCPPGDFYLDPVRPVDRAVVTHGHSDHARAGHGVVVATPATLDIMRLRYGDGFCGAEVPLPYGGVLTRDGVEIGLAPAGHILGSAQAVVRCKGRTIVVSGDYKRRPDPTCQGFEPVSCDVFITEATFGLPVFIHPPAEREAARLLTSLSQFPDRPHLVGVYALGKAQRLISILRGLGYDAPIYVHGALTRLNGLYEAYGVPLGDLRPAEAAPRQASRGFLVLAPPSAIDDRWSRRFGEPLTAFASGWMRVRARARQRGVELPLVISDHADWRELTETALELSPEALWVTHGREEALVRWAALTGLDAKALQLVGYDDDDEPALDPAGAADGREAGAKDPDVV